MNRRNAALDTWRQRPACVTSMHGCRSMERRGDRRQAAKAASKLTLQDIRSGAAEQLPSSAASAAGAAAVPGCVLAAPVVQPATPFADASVQVLCRLAGMASKGRKHTHSLDARMLLSQARVWRVWGPAEGARSSLELGDVCRAIRSCRWAELQQRAARRARLLESCSLSRRRGTGAPGAG